MRRLAFVMQTNVRSLFALAAAFIAGAFVFVPLRSFAGPQPGGSGSTGEIAVFPSLSDRFVIKNGNKMSLCSASYNAKTKREEITILDTKTIP